MLCTRAKARKQGIADAGVRTLTSLDWRWTPSDAWQENGIRCMIASSASNACGMLDPSPPAMNLFHEFIGERMVRVRIACSGLPQSLLARRDASEKTYGTSESHFVLAVASDLMRRTMVRAFRRSAWSPSTSSRFSNLFVRFHPGQQHDVRTRSFSAAADSAYRTPQKYPRDAPPLENCTVHPIVHPRPPWKRSVVLPSRTACLNVIWLVLRHGKHL